MRFAALLTQNISRRSVAAVAGAALVGAASSAVAELDQVKLHGDMQSIIDSYVTASDGIITPAGPVLSAIEGGTVVLTAPALQFKVETAEFNVPPIVVRLDEIDADRIGYAVILPNEFTGIETKPEVDNLLITLGQHEITGVYRPSINVFERFFTRIDRMRASVNNGALELGALHFDITSAETAPGDWRADQRFAFNDIKVFGPGQQQMLAIGSIESLVDLERFDLPAYSAISERISGGNPMFGMPQPDEAVAQAAMVELVQRLPEMLDGASGKMSFRMSDLDVAAINSPAFRLGAAALAVGIGPDNAQYGLDVNLAVDNPTIDPAGSPVPANLVPSRLAADAGLRKLPIQLIWQMIAEPLERHLADGMSADSEKALDEAMEMAPFAAMGMAAEAGSFAQLRSVEFAVGPARFTASGVGPLTPGMPEPPLRVVAQVEGLDALVEEVQALAPGMRDQAMPVLVGLKGLGKAESQDGQIVYTYLVEQGPKGDIVVNGVALDDLGK